MRATPHQQDIFVRIPEGVDLEDPEASGQVLLEYFSQQLKGEFRGALDLDLEDERANLFKIEVEEVEAFSNRIAVHYWVRWDAYYGCSDQDRADADLRSCFGTRRGDYWAFPRHITPPPLAPNEEL